jgi:hypothetical protein
MGAENWKLLGARYKLKCVDRIFPALCWDVALDDILGHRTVSFFQFLDHGLIQCVSNDDPQHCAA